MARQGWTSESDIWTRLEAKGCRLTEPAVFVEVLNGLERDVLEGSAVVPLPCEQLSVYPASGAPKAERSRLPAPITQPSLLPGGRAEIRVGQRFRFL